MKSYYRYEPSHSFGLITSPRSNAIYDYSGNLCLSGCLQDCKVFNIRQGAQVCFQIKRIEYVFLILII